MPKTTKHVLAIFCLSSLAAFSWSENDIELIPASKLDSLDLLEINEIVDSAATDNNSETISHELPHTTRSSESVKVNVVKVNEQFYKLTLNPETGEYLRQETTEAKPGDLIELVVTAVNVNDIDITDIEMTNTVPAGPVVLLPESIQTDETKSLYRLSRNGTDFFSSDAGPDLASIGYIRWLIFSLAPGEKIELSYRIQMTK